MYLAAHRWRYFTRAGNLGSWHRWATQGHVFCAGRGGVWYLDFERAERKWTHGQWFQNGWRYGTQIILRPNKFSKYLVLLKQQDCYVSKGTSNKVLWADAVCSVFLCRIDTSDLDMKAGACKTWTICALLKEPLQGWLWAQGTLIHAEASRASVHHTVHRTVIRACASAKLAASRLPEATLSLPLLAWMSLKTPGKMASNSCWGSASAFTHWMAAEHPHWRHLAYPEKQPDSDGHTQLRP